MKAIVTIVLALSVTATTLAQGTSSDGPGWLTALGDNTGISRR